METKTDARPDLEPAFEILDAVARLRDRAARPRDDAALPDPRGHAANIAAWEAVGWAHKHHGVEEVDLYRLWAEDRAAKALAAGTAAGAA